MQRVSPCMAAVLALCCMCLVRVKAERGDLVGSVPYLQEEENTEGSVVQGCQQRLHRAGSILAMLSVPVRNCEVWAVGSSSP